MMRVKKNLWASLHQQALFILGFLLNQLRSGLKRLGHMGRSDACSSQFKTKMDIQNVLQIAIMRVARLVLIYSF
jgi:hypothetical protein